MRPRRATTRLVPAFLAALWLLAWSPVAQANDQIRSKVDSSVETVIEATGGTQAVPVIVSAPGGEAQVLSMIPVGVRVTRLPIVDGVAAFLTPEEIRRLGSADFVADIVADNPIYGFSDQSSMSVTNLTIGLGQLEPWDAGGPSGAGVTVAILDSGIATNTDLAQSRIVGWKDFVNEEPLPYDDAGHGTFVAGLIAGDGTGSLPLEDGGYAEFQFRGVAPEANLVGIKVLDESGQGRASALVAGIAWAIDHKDEYGIRILNISIGGNPVGSIKQDPVARAVEAAWQRGIVVVCAAGNEGEFGPGGILSPGNDPFVITVGATDTKQSEILTDDVVAGYSSIGPTLFDEIVKPDLVAPGNKLISLRAQGSYIDRTFPENIVPVTEYATQAPAGTVSAYLRLSGTSTSAPLVTGAAALMLGEDGTLTPDDVKLRLMRTADAVEDAGRYQQGAGTLDVDEALADNSRAQGYALSPFVGKGKSFYKNADYDKWESRSWAKYGWTKFKWTKFKWTKFKWTEVAWTKFKWTKFKWTEYEWAKFKWTVLLQGQ
jgi:serine protease AprX